MGWLLVMGIKECLVECATLSLKSEVMHSILLNMSEVQELSMGKSKPMYTRRGRPGRVDQARITILSF